jgi:hypothetical protein
MESLIDKLEFGNIKQLRKNLLVVSATGIVISQLVKYSEDGVTFFGFSLSENNLPLLNKLIWFIVLYFFVALVIRYFDDEFQKYYKSKLESIGTMYTFGYKSDDYQKAIQKENLNKRVKSVDRTRRVLIFLLDLIVPLTLGVIALVMTWEF